MTIAVTYPDAGTWQADLTGYGAGVQTFRATATDGTSVDVSIDIPFPARRVATNPMLGKTYAAGPYQRIVYAIGDVLVPVTHAFSANAVVKTVGVPGNFAAQIALAQNAVFDLSGVQSAGVALGSAIGMSVDATLAWAAGQALHHGLGIGWQGSVGYEDTVDDAVPGQGYVSVYALDADATFDLPGAGSIALPAHHGIIVDATVSYDNLTGQATIVAREPSASVTARIVLATVAGKEQGQGTIIHRSVTATIKAGH